MRSNLCWAAMKGPRAFLALFLMLGAADFCQAGERTYVRGHFRSNGAYVPHHYRTSPDSSFYNNWSTIGNVNPYTGEYGTKVAPTISGRSGLRPSSIAGFSYAPIPPSLSGAARQKRPGLPSIQTSNGLPDEVAMEIQRQAKSQWGDDYAMQAYTLEKQREGYLSLKKHVLDFERVGVPEEIRRWALDHATRQWPEDYSMQAYSYEKNLDGYLRLSALLSSSEYTQLPEVHADWMVDVAYRSWSDDFSMQAYVLEKQLDGYYRLAQLTAEMKGLPQDVFDSILREARESWPEDLSMQAYVVGRDYEGYKKLQLISR